jgi:hypothetical protein
MSSKNKLVNINNIFRSLSFESYCLIKLSEIFPDYRVGSDVDIFCLNVDKITSIILKELNPICNENISIKVTRNIYHIYIDIIENNSINFRFDLYGSMPIYKNIQIKSSYFSSIIENSIQKNFENENFFVKVPSKIDDSILRYIEYQEWYSERPDKIKHIDYLNEKISNKELDLNKMLDKLHYYITVPLNFDNRISSKNKYIRNFSFWLNLIKKGLFQLRNKGVGYAFKKVKKHFD